MRTLCSPCSRLITKLNKRFSCLCNVLNLGRCSSPIPFFEQRVACTDTTRKWTMRMYLRTCVASCHLDLVCPRQVAKVPLAKLAPNLRLADMNEIPNHGVIQLVGAHDFSLQQAALFPPHLTATLLVDQEPPP